MCVGSAATRVTSSLILPRLKHLELVDVRIPKDDME